MTERTTISKPLGLQLLLRINHYGGPPEIRRLKKIRKYSFRDYSVPKSASSDLSNEMLYDEYANYFVNKPMVDVTSDVRWYTV